MSPRLFADAQAALERRRYGARTARAESETETWWLRNAARCGLCGAKMSAAYAGDHDARRYYYRCYARCTSRYVPVRAAEEEVSPLVAARLAELRPSIVEVVAASRTRALVASRMAELRPVNVDAKLEQITRRRARYVEAYADGALERDELRAKLAKLDDDRTRILAQAAPEEPIVPAKGEAAIREAGAMARAWKNATPTHRRAIVATIAVAVYLAPEQAARVEWVSAEDLARRA